MPLITTCPACQAKFVVSTAQLEAHHGDVRCGKCKHVFNALAHLASIPDAENTAHELQANTANMVESSPVEISNQAEITQAALFADEVAPKDEQAEVAHTATNNASSEIPSEAEVSVEENNKEEKKTISNKATVIPAFDAANFQLEDDSQPKISKKSKSKAKVAASPPSDESSLLEDIQPKKSTWLSWLLVLILLVLAGLQATYYFRTEISARYPQLKPYLVQACDALGCNVDLPKEPNLLVIDDSDLQEDADREGLIRLNTTLLNKAEFAVAYPLLEITLTDATDKVLMRKRFKPNEYLAPETPIAEGIPANDSVYIHLALTANKQAVAGYRLFISY